MKPHTYHIRYNASYDIWQILDETDSIIDTCPTEYGARCEVERMR